jgi:hypothetical protein
VKVMLGALGTGLSYVLLVAAEEAVTEWIDHLAPNAGWKSHPAYAR